MIFQKSMAVWPCRRRQQDLKTIIVLKHVWFDGIGTPGLQKATWTKKHFGLPLTIVQHGVLYVTQ